MKVRQESDIENKVALEKSRGKRLNCGLSIVVTEIEAKVDARETGLNGQLTRRVRTRQLGRRSTGNHTGRTQPSRST